MKKRWLMALALLVCLCLLTACKTSEPDRYQVKTQNPGQQQTAGTTGSTGNQVLVDDEYMDPLAEEDYNNFDDSDWMEELPTAEPPTPTPALVFRGEYAGATPVPIDPIDKPTPTAVPKLQVAYAAYDAKKLGLSFEGPAGWLQDDSAEDTFILQNPDARMDYAATLTLTAKKVSADYSTSDLKSVVNGMLDSIGAANFAEYDPSQTDSRSLLGKNGIYANYTGTLLVNGEEVNVAGRVHAVCVDKVLYTLHLTTPRAQWNDYKDMVYDKIRDTLTIVK